jgi:cell wall-associated NlpC family hydrolase
MRTTLALLLVVLCLSGCASAPRRPGPADAGRATAALPAVPALGARAAELAVRLVGAPYRFGGESPAGFDCSGLVWYVFRELGVGMPRTAAAQRAAIRPVSADELEPGDLVFFYTPEDHVGIYLGDHEFVHAPTSGRAVERARLDSPFFILGFAGGGRVAAQRATAAAP